jgi:hypothetical protein
MAQTITPHYDHHLREFYRTRRRFRLVVAALFAGMFVLVGTHSPGGNAATSYMVSGRVYNTSTSLGMANIKLRVCWSEGASFYVVTNSTGEWSTSLPYQAHICLRYSSGAPTNVTGPIAANNRPEHAGAASYEYQVVGYNCYQNTNSACSSSNQTWDRALDSGNRFNFANAATPAPVPTPIPTPAPTPKPATTTPKPPASTSTPTSPQLGSAPASAEGADVVPPTAPGSFQATVADGNAVVTLAWEASTDASGIKGYVLERSLDQASWEKVAESIQGTSYSDKGAGFGIHYYYRLSALDPAGNVSGYATADVVTDDFNANSGGTEGTVYTSDDSFATVTVPPGAVTEDADCSVSTINTKDGGHKPGTQDQSLVVGPYSVLCKTAGGTQITEFSKPLSWSFNLKGRLKGLNNPKAYSYDSSGPGTLVKGYVYDSKGQTIRVDSTSTAPIMVLAAVQHGISLNFVAALLLVLGIIAGVAVLILRRRQKTSYDDYLRSKYYNL